VNAERKCISESFHFFFFFFFFFFERKHSEKQRRHKHEGCREPEAQNQLWLGWRRNSISEKQWKKAKYVVALVSSAAYTKIFILEDSWAEWRNSYAVKG